MSTSAFTRIGRRTPAVLYRPEVPTSRSRTAILVMHSDADYLTFSAGPELSRRGYTVMCANVADRSSSLDQKIREVGGAVDALLATAGISSVVLLGHSGGGTLLSAYQAIAENGPGVFQGPDLLHSCPDDLAGLTPAAGLMLLDSNWGNGAMRLLSLDPAVVDEDDAMHVDPALDLFDPANGFDPAGSQYSADFVSRFQQAQGERNNRVIDRARERMAVIEAGRGVYRDDEPFVVAGAAQGFRNNKLYAQDTRLMSRTRAAHTLLELDGSRTVEVVETMRSAENPVSLTGSYADGALVTTVRTFLDSFAVRTLDDYAYDATTLTGVDWSSSYTCTTGNVRQVSAPLLVMGMTGGWEFAASETIHDESASDDKTLAYVEGADHLFRPIPTLAPSSDTQQRTYDFVDEWLGARDRPHS